MLKNLAAIKTETPAKTTIKKTNQHPKREKNKRKNKITIVNQNDELKFYLDSEIKRLG